MAPAPTGLELGDETVTPAAGRTCPARRRSLDRVVAARASVVIQPRASTSTRTSTSSPSTGSATRSAQVDVEPAHGARHDPGLLRPRDRRPCRSTPLVTGDAGGRVRDRAVDGRATGRHRRGRCRPARGAGQASTRSRSRSTGVSSRPKTVESTSRCRRASSPVDAEQVTVTITLRPVTATRTFEAGRPAHRRAAGLRLRGRHRPGPAHDRRVDRRPRPADRHRPSSSTST